MIENARATASNRPEKNFSLDLGRASVPRNSGNVIEHDIFRDQRVKL